MRVSYDDKHDLLYIEFDDSAEQLRNEDLSDGIVVDLTDDDRIAGMEILGASRRFNLSKLLPVEFVLAVS
jgi:uncharacterized protein YuzE